MGHWGQQTPWVVVTGATGRMGRVLRLLWPPDQMPPVLWMGRQQDWPSVPPGSVILHLAAALQGPGLADNAALTAGVCCAAIDTRAAHVFAASSVAVYGPGEALSETDTTGPISPYGQSKRAAEEAARRLLSAPNGPGLTLLRIGNLAGADALLGGAVAGREVLLDPVAGQPGGPLRSYVGPGVLAEVLRMLVQRAVTGGELPDILNVAQPGLVSMAALLDAAGLAWRFGPPNPGVQGRVGLSVARLQSLVPPGMLPPATAPGIVADLMRIKDHWP